MTDQEFPKFSIYYKIMRKKIKSTQNIKNFVLNKYLQLLKRFPKYAMLCENTI